jgi:hypothetical protein
MTLKSGFGKGACVRLVALSLAVLFGTASESLGQAEWKRTVQVIAPIKDGDVTQALLDSTVAVLKSQNVPVQRSPESDTTSLQTIQQKISEEGLALTSATHTFITYRFHLSSGDFQREIFDLYFIYRPTAQQEEDIPILYLDLSRGALYEKLLVERGTTLPSNEATFLPFREQIGFRASRDMMTVVQVGDQIIRDPERAASKKKQLLETLRNLAYGRP